MNCMICEICLDFSWSFLQKVYRVGALRYPPVDFLPWIRFNSSMPMYHTDAWPNLAFDSVAFLRPLWRGSHVHWELWEKPFQFWSLYCVCCWPSSVIYMFIYIYIYIWMIDRHLNIFWWCNPLLHIRYPVIIIQTSLLMGQQNMYDSFQRNTHGVNYHLLISRIPLFPRKYVTLSSRNWLGYLLMIINVFSYIDQVRTLWWSVGYLHQGR